MATSYFRSARSAWAASRRAPLATESSRRRYTLTYNNHEITAGHLYELLEPAEGTEVIAPGPIAFTAGKAAITSRRVGEGAVIYVGAYLTDDLVTHFVPGILSRADVHPLLPDLPEGVEVTVREAADRQLMFILNTREQRIHVRGVPDGLDLLTGTPVESHAVHLGEYGCSIIQVRHAT